MAYRVLLWPGLWHFFGPAYGTVRKHERSSARSGSMSFERNLCQNVNRVGYGHSVDTLGHDHLVDKFQ